MESERDMIMRTWRRLLSEDNIIKRNWSNKATTDLEGFLEHFKAD